MMANKKKDNKPKSRVTLVDLLAFIGLAAAAILLLVGPILRWVLKKTGGEIVLQVLNILSMYCLLAAIAIPAWYFVRHKRKGWKVAYFIFLAVYIIGTIFGVTLGIL